MADPGGCWECKQKNGHAETGGVHRPWHCKPDRCPDREKHAERVYGDRLQSRLTGAGRDGVTTTAYIDGKKASSAHVQSRCICGLLLIWTPKATAASADSEAAS